jgi:hypothetical protein
MPELTPEPDSTGGENQKKKSEKKRVTPYHETSDCFFSGKMIAFPSFLTSKSNGVRVCCVH